MRGADLRAPFGAVDFGIATAARLAAPAGTSLSAQSQRWSADLVALLGSAPRHYQMVAGWSDLQPERPGDWSVSALDRCDHRLDQMLERGILPGLTLLHNDMPPWADDSGGWLRRDTALRFADFAAELGARFGDRVVRWTTASDILVHSVADYVAGMLPPGRGVGARGLAALHHVLLGSGLAVQALKQTTAEVGTSMTLIGAYAASDDVQDVMALERLESWAYRLFLDPLLLGRHMLTEDGRSPVAETGCVRTGDMEIVAERGNVLGLVWHVPSRVAAPANLARFLPARECFSALNDANGLLSRLGFVLVPMESVETTGYGWPAVPEALADACAVLHDLYGAALPPLRIVDNGMHDIELPSTSDTEERCEQRRSSLARQLGWLAQIIAEGVEISGYDYWSLMDNADWKLRYTRHYAMAVDDRPHPAQPSIPLDWVHQEAFGGRPAAAAEGSVPRGRRALRLA